MTGGAGYIGSHTVLELLSANQEVVVIDNLSNSNEESLKRVSSITGKKIHFYRGDLLDKGLVDNIFVKHDIDSVIHFAGLKAVGESNEIPLTYYRNNIAATISVLEIMATHNVKSFVFSSSATVYGDPASVPINESFPTSATNPYGRSKLMIEEVLADLYESDNSWNIACLRYFNPVGAHKSGLIGEDPNGIPNNLMPFISQVAVGKRELLSVYGNDYNTHDGTGVRDYIHVVDLALGHLKALDKLKSNPGRVTYNLGTGCGYSVLEMIKAFEKAANKTIPYRIVERRMGDIAECYAATDLAEEELGWKANLSISDMTNDTWRWQTMNPNGYE